MLIFRLHIYLPPTSNQHVNKIDNFSININNNVIKYIHQNTIDLYESYTDVRFD